MQPRSDWDDLDWDLLSALDRLERDVSETTGLPWWLTRTGHPSVGFSVETTEDEAEATLDRYDEKERGKKKKKPGSHRYAAAHGIDGFATEGGLAREEMLLYASKQLERDPDDDLGDLIERRMPEGGWRADEYGDGDASG